MTIKQRVFAPLPRKFPAVSRQDWLMYHMEEKMIPPGKIFPIFLTVDWANRDVKPKEKDLLYVVLGSILLYTTPLTGTLAFKAEEHLGRVISGSKFSSNHSLIPFNFHFHRFLFSFTPISVRLKHAREFLRPIAQRFIVLCNIQFRSTFFTFIACPQI